MGEAGSGRIVGNDLIAEVRRFVGTPDVGASENLKRFFRIELDNYSTAVRQGDIDPSDGYHPTLATAVDSLSQAPDDVRENWLGMADYSDRGEAVSEGIATAVELANLIAICGPDARLDEFMR